MDAANANRDPLAGSYTAAGRTVASPHPDGPGNEAWQRALALLHQVEAQEDARRRRN